MSNFRQPLCWNKWFRIARQTVIMNKTSIEQEIASLEERLAEAKASKPAHDTTGVYEAILLEIEDELAEKRQALAALGATDRAKPA